MQRRVLIFDPVAFALNLDQAVEDNEPVIVSTFVLCGVLAYILIDKSTSHSFISARFVKRHKLLYVFFLLSVATPMSHSMLAKRLVLSCSLEFEGNDLNVNSMILAIEDIDCILRIDMLNAY